ncbi:hypothetical protein [Paenibacillus sp. AN1007]|uniref:Uncharacterized protein n=1 Tax=Paenibacillus sp. AN1007 TaxID=3151385 RepID=A0AAU8NF08_9BACL
MMDSTLNRWSVSEYMKHRYIRTGHVPDREELQTEFMGIDQTELLEGIAEFDAIVGTGGVLHAEVD